MESSQVTFKIHHPHAAGIDVGSRSHLVAIDHNKDNVREFGVYIKDHQQMISHLHQHGVTTIAMEGTGSYWQTLFNALQQAGFDVLLVSGSQTKNVKAGRPGGRKGNCWDNAVAESFFKTFKSELVNHAAFPTRTVARLATFEYIKGWRLPLRYNRRRRHSRQNYQTPTQQESYFYTTPIAA
jgi:hypothetical protein